MRGIVRSAAIDRNSWQEPALAMRVASEGGEFNVRVPIVHEQDFSSWVDSEVLIEGVCGSLYNANRQLTGILFYVPRLSFMKVEAPATRSTTVGVAAVFAGERERGTAYECVASSDISSRAMRYFSRVKARDFAC